jgi:hypothetical protein
MDDSPNFGKLFELAWLAYNSANTPITKDKAARSLVVAFETLIANNVASASSVTQNV